MATLRVRDLMTSPAQTIREDEPLETAAHQMTRAGVHSLVVTSANGEWIGVITSTDLLRALSEELASPEQLRDFPVDGLMTREVVTLGPDASVADAVAAMVEADARHIPVVDADNRLLGMVSDRDLRERLGTDLLRFARSPAGRTDESVTLVMTPNPTVLHSGTHLGQALSAFADERLTAVPVVDESGRLLGVLSYVDVLRWLRDQAARPSAPMGDWQ